MSISNALANAYSGLTAASRRAETTANNLANATTAGYARQSVDLSAQVTGGRGSGVMVDGVSRSTTPALTAMRREAGNGAGGASLDAASARTVAEALGGADDPNALFLKVEALETGLRTLAEAPDSVAAQENAAASAVALASALNTASGSVLSMREQADVQIGRKVESLNNAFKAVETLNRQISKEQSTGRPIAALVQQRENVLETIAAEVPITTLPRGAGEITVLSEQGIVLVDHDAREIAFTPTAAISADMDFRGGTGGLSGLSIDGYDITPGGGQAQSLSRGALAALFETRDATGIEAMNALDGLAQDLVTRFEGAGLAGPSGRGLFTDAGAALAATPAAGLAGRIAVHEGVDAAQGGGGWRLRDGLEAATPGNVGNATLPAAMRDAMTTRQTPPAGTGLTTPASAAGLAADLGSLFETRAQTMEDIEARAVAYRDTLAETESRTNGVDVDRELQELLMIETAYAANARVMEVMDQLTRRLMEI